MTPPLAHGTLAEALAGILQGRGIGYIAPKEGCPKSFLWDVFFPVAS